MRAAKPYPSVCTALALGLAMTVLASQVSAQPKGLEIVASARTTHLTASHTFRVPPRQARLAEVRIRSGSLGITLDAVEIVFSDRTIEPTILQQHLPPGHQSRAVPVRNRQDIREIVVTMRPGMRQGETTLQLLGRLIRRP